MEIILGTYEDYILGYEFNDKSNTLDQTFAVRGHSGSVRSVASSPDGSLILSAGHDEVINLFTLKKRKLLQTIDGAINCAVFADDKHLICGSEDSNIYIYEYKASNLKLVKTLKGHQEAITSLSVHPTGKVLLSVSKDNSMRTWNLIKGRCAFVTQIKMQAHLISWSKTGDEMLLAANSEIYLYTNNTGSLEHTIKLEKRVNSIEFVDKDTILVATDSGKLEFFSIRDGTSLLSFQAHDTRIKCIRLLSTGQIESSDTTLVTASSDGVLKVWRISHESNKLREPLELRSLDIGARLTCMTTANTNR